PQRRNPPQLPRRRHSRLHRPQPPQPHRHPHSRRRHLLRRAPLSRPPPAPPHPPAPSNPLDLRAAVPMTEALPPVANPAVDADGNVYATVSGPRGQAVPVSIFQIQRDFQMRPFVRDVMNVTGIAFGPDASLSASPRAEGTVYRISQEGAAS